MPGVQLQKADDDRRRYRHSDKVADFNLVFSWPHPRRWDTMTTNDRHQPRFYFAASASTAVLRGTVRPSTAREL